MAPTCSNTSTDYKKGETEITADIYFMDGKLNAFGIYSAERSPGYNFIKVGAEGYLEDSILNFLQGPYYVKLMAYSPKGKTNALLRDIANDISKRIGTGKKFPTALKRFPTDNLVARSEMYLNKAPLACEFLEPAFKANYMFGEKKSSLFISIAKNAKEARARVEKMKARVAKAGEVKTLSGLGKMAFSGKDKYIGEMIAFPKSRYAIFLINPPENPEAFLKKTAEGLTRKK